MNQTIRILEELALERNLEWKLEHGPTHINRENDELAQLQYKVEGKGGRYLLFVQALYATTDLAVTGEKRLEIFKNPAMQDIASLGTEVMLATYSTSKLICWDDALNGTDLLSGLIAQVSICQDGTLNAGLRNPNHAAVIDGFDQGKDLKGIATYLFDYIYQ